MINENQNPWQILDEKKIYDNNWIDLTEYNVINPNGGKGIYGKVHFRNYAIGIIVLDEELNTYLVGQYRFPIEQYSWELPEGGGPLDIDPLESAKKELMEETGLLAKDWTLLFNMHLSNSVSDEYSYVFLARNLEQHSPMPEETEQLVVKKLPFDQAWQMLEDGTITDSITVAAILKVKHLLMTGRIA